MSIKLEWQLVAHNEGLTAAEGAVAQAIARRIRPDNEASGERIPIRTLYAESVGVKSKDTIERALARLISLGIIQVRKPGKGSRQASVITWALQCPEGCQLDHANGNTRIKTGKESTSPKATRPNPQDATRPNPQDALRSKERERDPLVSFISQTLKELPNPTPQHLELLSGLDNPEELAEIRTRAKFYLNEADYDEFSYLRKIITNSPTRLKPKPKPEQAPPDFSHLPPELAAAQMRKRERLISEGSIK